MPVFHKQIKNKQNRAWQRSLKPHMHRDCAPVQSTQNHTYTTHTYMKETFLKGSLLVVAHLCLACTKPCVQLRASHKLGLVVRACHPSTQGSWSRKVRSSLSSWATYWATCWVSGWPNKQKGKESLGYGQWVAHSSHPSTMEVKAGDQEFKVIFLQYIEFEASLIIKVGAWGGEVLGTWLRG